MTRGDVSIDWEESYFLNILLHHYNYSIDVSVRLKQPVSRLSCVGANAGTARKRPKEENGSTQKSLKKGFCHSPQN